jgi:hypothetical protein
MKKLLLLFLVCSLPLCAQEPPTKFKKGKAYVMPMGNGNYQSSITGKSGFTSTAKLKMKAYNKGVEFANEKGAKLEVIGYETVQQSFMVFPQAIMSFRLVYNSVEINDPNDPNTITVSQTGNVLNNNQQTTIRMPNSKNNPKPLSSDEAIEELKKIKELYDLGLLNKDEFEKKSNELKKIILGN